MGRARHASIRWALGATVLALSLSGCGPSPAPADQEAALAPSSPTQARPLVVFVRTEPSSPAARPLVQAGASLRFVMRVFNALPALLDAQGMPHPELLASLPLLNSDDWQIFPDGSMLTTYALRPSLTWQDGHGLTADDFVFAWRVYSTPVLGLAGQPPWPAISDVAAPDPRHIVVHWKLPFPDADTLATKSSSAFPPLPRHILETVFDQISTSGRDAFDNHPYWGAQYVGAGPYRVQRWETGTFIDAVRFDQYALGAAKIPRIELRFSADQNVVIASLLAGAAHVATDSSISKAPEALTQQWGQSRAGAVFQAPSSLRYMGFQLRAEVANPRAILDARVRKAVAHAVDKAAVNEAIYAGLGVYADTPVWEGSAWGEALDSSIPTYPLDPRATESLMNQAGFTKGSDGFYRGQDGRLSLEVATTEGADNVREMLVYADRLAAAGLSVEQRALPAAQAQNGQVRSSFPSMQITGIGMGEQALNGLASSQISTADNKWTGGNVNGWSSAAFDALLDGFNTTLNRSERVLLVRHMLRVFADELPMVALFFNAQPFAYVKELRGPAPTAPESNLAWNIHEWEFE